MPSLRIALFLPSLEGGGAERVFVQLANEFAAMGFRVDLVLAQARGSYIDKVSEIVQIVDLGASGVLQAVPKFSRYLQEATPRAVLSGLDHANIAAILSCVISRTGTRCVVSVRAVPTAVYRAKRSIRRWLILQATKVAYRFSDEIVACSRGVAKDLLDSLHINADKISIIYNPLDMPAIDESSKAASNHPWLSSEDSPLIVSVGSLTVFKDFKTLIRAFSLVRSKHKARLAILGEGPQRRELESLARVLNLQSDVYLPGFVENPYIWMRRANVFVSSSLTEGCPNVLMEALACDTPIVSTDCFGGSSEILLGGEFGCLVPVGDSEAMARAIVSTLTSSSRVDGQRRARDFSVAAIAKQYLRVILPSHLPYGSKG